MEEPTLHRHGGFRHAHPNRESHRHLLHPRRATAATGSRGALRNATYRRLLAAQVGSLAGTGVTTVALGLLAYDLAGANAGAILGGALALKMVAYVGLSPVFAAFTHRFDRKRLLIGLDLGRALLLASLPFVTEAWQVFVVIFLVNACAAGFTPAFQATIPAVLPDEDDYTEALSLSRVAYDLADLLAPIAAAGLLLLVDFHVLFAVNATTFLVSAAIIATTMLPATAPGEVSGRTWKRISAGTRAFVRSPRLRPVLALNIAVASASAMVIVNTVVLVRDQLQLDASHVALAVAAAAAGSVVTALNVPRLVRRSGERTVMLSGGVLLTAGLLLSVVADRFAVLLAVWVVLGTGLALVQTPIGRLLQQSAPAGELPPLFAAQFALSHLCWLVTYLIAGAGSVAGVAAVAAVLAVLAGLASAGAALLWRPVAAADPPVVSR